MAHLDLQVTLDSGAVVTYNFTGIITAQVNNEANKIIESIVQKRAQVFIYGNEGDRIRGIKAVRTLTGYGLKEAKDLADLASYGGNPNLMLEAKPQRVLIPGYYTNDQVAAVMNLLKEGFETVEVY